MGVSPRHFRVGLTGGIASGKTCVAQMFAGHGAHIIDADMLARQVVEPGKPAWAAIYKHFGPKVIRADGKLDRAAIAEIVFADEVARKALNAIVHPAVRKAARAEEADLPSGAVVMHVIPLLVETSQSDDFDSVIVVDVDSETQLRRLMLRDGLDEEQAKARMAAQATREQRLRSADYVIDNSGSSEQTRYQVDKIWGEIMCQYHRFPSGRY